MVLLSGDLLEFLSKIARIVSGLNALFTASRSIWSEVSLLAGLGVKKALKALRAVSVFVNLPLSSGEATSGPSTLSSTGGVSVTGASLLGDSGGLAMGSCGFFAPTLAESKLRS